MKLQANTILNYRYQILDSLGQGGFGITYLAVDTILDSEVCIKELYISGSSTRGQNMTVLTQNINEFSFSDFKNRFLQEAKQLSRFNHFNIVRVIDYFEENNTAYYAMEYIDGETLKDLVISSGPLEFNQSIQIIKQLLNAVETVHKAGMLHRDIKPDNIIIAEDGRVVLIDFGSAREYDESKTLNQTAMISPCYAPLEQYNPNAKKGAYTDIYSIGATFYFMLTGHKPLNVIERYTERMIAPHELNKSVDIRVSSAIMLAMEMKPEDRFQNAIEFKEAISIIEHAVNKTFSKVEKIALNYSILVDEIALEVYHSDLGKMSWDEAKMACNDLGEGWRLPSKEELEQMHIQLHAKNKGNFQNDYYWSSTEKFDLIACFYRFYIGYADFSGKLNSYFVRAVRN